MDINLFHTNVNELSEKLVGTKWMDQHGVTRTIKRVYVDGWWGAYCVEWDDGTWNRVEQVLENGVLQS